MTLGRASASAQLHWCRSPRVAAASLTEGTAFLLAWTRSACTPAGRFNVVQSGFDGGDNHAPLRFAVLRVRHVCPRTGSISTHVGACEALQCSFDGGVYRATATLAVLKVRLLCSRFGSTSLHVSTCDALRSTYAGRDGHAQPRLDLRGCVVSALAWARSARTSAGARRCRAALMVAITTHRSDSPC